MTASIKDLTGLYRRTLFPPARSIKIIVQPPTAQPFHVSITQSVSKVYRLLLVNFSSISQQFKKGIKSSFFSQVCGDNFSLLNKTVLMLAMQYICLATGINVCLDGESLGRAHPSSRRYFGEGELQLYCLPK